MKLSWTRNAPQVARIRAMNDTPSNRIDSTMIAGRRARASLGTRSSSAVDSTVTTNGGASTSSEISPAEVRSTSYVTSKQ